MEEYWEKELNTHVEWEQAMIADAQTAPEARERLLEAYELRPDLLSDLRTVSPRLVKYALVERDYQAVCIRDFRYCLMQEQIHGTFETPASLFNMSVRLREILQGMMDDGFFSQQLTNGIKLPAADSLQYKCLAVLMPCTMTHSIDKLLFYTFLVEHGFTKEVVAYYTSSPKHQEDRVRIAMEINRLYAPYQYFIETTMDGDYMASNTGYDNSDRGWYYLHEYLMAYGFSPENVDKFIELRKDNYAYERFWCDSDFRFQLRAFQNRYGSNYYVSQIRQLQHNIEKCGINHAENRRLTGCPRPRSYVESENGQ